jgi:hypothetical protein
MQCCPCGRTRAPTIPRRAASPSGGLQKLERMGLATAAGPGQWMVGLDAELALRDLGMRGAIIKTMHRASTERGQDRGIADYVIDSGTASPPVIGLPLSRTSLKDWRHIPTRHDKLAQNFSTRFASSLCSPDGPSVTRTGLIHNVTGANTVRIRNVRGIQFQHLLRIDAPPLGDADQRITGPYRY